MKLNDNPCTYTTGTKTPTKEEMLVAIYKFAQFMEDNPDPWEEYAKKNGFSLDAGDCLVLPDFVQGELEKAKLLHLVHKQVKFSRYVDNPIFVRRSFFYGPINTKNDAT